LKEKIHPQSLHRPVLPDLPGFFKKISRNFEKTQNQSCKINRLPL